MSAEFLFTCEHGRYPWSLFTCLVARQRFDVMKIWQHPGQQDVLFIELLLRWRVFDL